MPKQKVISFSLWGDEALFNEGAMQNVFEARIYYPDWRCRFYVPDHSKVAGYLENVGAEVVRMADDGHWPRYFWRFQAADDPNVSRVLFRDADSRLNAREAAAVGNWCERPDRRAHVMRDAEAHAGVKICAGMWGLWGSEDGDLTPWQHVALRPEAPAAMDHYLESYVDLWLQQNRNRRAEKSADEYFLGEMVWPLIEPTAVVHGQLGEPWPPHGRMRFGEYVGQPIPPGTMPSFEVP